MVRYDHDRHEESAWDWETESPESPESERRSQQHLGGLKLKSCRGTQQRVEDDIWSKSPWFVLSGFEICIKEPIISKWENDKLIYDLKSINFSRKDAKISKCLSLSQNT